MANNTKLVNTSQSALCLPDPYMGVVGPGKAVILGDTPGNVALNLGSAATGSQVATLALDTVDPVSPSYSPNLTAYAQGGSPWTLPRVPPLQYAMVGALTGPGIVNLPAAPTVGQICYVKDAGGTAASQTVTVKTTDGTQIDGTAGSTGKPLASVAFTFTEFIFNGTQWFTI